MIKIRIVIILHIMLFACSGNNSFDENAKKMLILGIDGMDPYILAELMEQGKMPGFQKLAASGSFEKLFSSIPPQSPVAWSNVITGGTPETHKIFDFLHRNPETLIPYFSTAETKQPDVLFSLGGWKIPFGRGSTKLLRKGVSFWEILEDNNVPSTIIKIPSNFPPVKSNSLTLSGMGTPDMAGSYGEFSFYTNDPVLLNTNDVSGGKIISVEIKDHFFESSINGPVNAFKKDESTVTIPFSVYIDENSNSARLDIQNHRIILTKGELSEWVELEYDMLPFISSVKGICRFMLTGIKPFLKLYVSPVNISPVSPAMPISTPGGFSGDIADHIGLFYTQGMPEDTKAYEHGVLNLDEFIIQSSAVLEERKRMYRYCLENWKSGLLFFYFSSLDQISHMLWWERDKRSALFDDSLYIEKGDLIEKFYIEIDGILEETMAKINDDIQIVVMSDHGFAPYYKKVNLNTWLMQEGYLRVFRTWDNSFDHLFANVDWNKSQAYALGLNSLYINQRNRESEGIVNPEDKQSLMKEIKEKLLKLKDPENGNPIISNIYITEELYPNAEMENAPDMIIGYARGYRCSDKSALGELSENVLEINTDKWSGDHCMDYTEVPGIIVTNKQITKNTCYLYDIMPTILKTYGIQIPENIAGQPIY